ncbi:MAG TPA: hypothetical protein VFN74_18490 [Chloroflexota bacterium]|nr:hypothetical protein [Chloroflexota bacterium]
MTVRPKVRVLFTLDCPAAGPKAVPYGPPNWELSARALYAFSAALLDAGYPPTLFVSPEAAQEHAPMLEELASGGADVGLLVHPPLLRGAGYRHLLGAYSRAQQEAIVENAKRRLTETLGRRPLSVRSALFSANDATFGALDALGFRQASLSSPGRRVKKHHAEWDGAAPDAHRASATDRRGAGDLELLEVPVTTDPTQRNDGIAPDLAIENGTLERWHAPLIEAQLQRQDDSAVTFRTLCFVTSTRFPYHDTSARQRQTLDELLDYLDALAERYDVAPQTLSATAVEFHG